MKINDPIAVSKQLTHTSAPPLISSPCSNPFCSAHPFPTATASMSGPSASIRPTKSCIPDQSPGQVIELVTMGSVNRAMVEPMEVFSTPLQKRAVKLILAHNHPAGILRPSTADRLITADLIRLGRELKVPVIDNVIITEDGYFSFAEQGEMKELPKKEIMHATIGMNTSSFRRIRTKKKTRRRFV